ncbi:MAG: VCBS repeat-containing protein [Acidobacteria bacterium]|nr:VCBS repeat-containing protein [Acidobacteriota bacterium]
MKKGFTLLLLAITLVVSAISPILAQDFAFGGAGGVGGQFRDSVFIPTPLANFGVTGASRTLVGTTLLVNGYLNNITNTAANRLPNSNSTSFNATDVGIFDMDADQFPDLVVVSDDNNATQVNAPLIPAGVLGTGTARVTLFTGTGDGTFGIPVSVVASAVGPLSATIGATCLTIGDLNLDGIGDAVVGFSDAGGSGVVQIFSGGNLATNTIAGLTNNVVPVPGGGNANAPVSVDLERISDDAFPDLVIATTNFGGPFTSQLSVIPSNASNAGLAPSSATTIGGLGGGNIGVNLLGAIGQLNSSGFILANRATAGFQSNILFPAVNGAVDTDFDLGVATSRGIEIFENTTPANAGLPVANVPLLTFAPAVLDANGAQSALPAGSGPIAFLPGDVNSDNVTDLNVLNFGSGTATTYVANAGTAGYQNPRTSVAGTNPTSGTLSNFDGDGKVDLLTADLAGAVVPLRGTGNGSFTFSPGDVISQLPLNPAAVASGTVDVLFGGTSDDIVIADGFSGFATGGVYFLSSANMLNPLFVRLFTAVSLAADFDGTGGLNDIAVMEQNLGNVFVLLNVSIAASPTITQLVLRDVFTNRDIRPTAATSFVDALTGLNNIAVTDIGTPQNTNGSGQIVVGINDGTGNFSNRNRLFRQFVATAGATNIVSGDFRNTGRATDLVYVDYQNNLAAVALNDGTNFFLTPQIRETGGFVPVSLAVADVNDDDNMDVVALNNGAAPNQTIGNQTLVSVLLGQGDGRLIPTGSLLNVPNFGLSIVGGLAVLDTTPIRRVVDFNQDGFPDFAVNSTRGAAGVFGSVTTPTVSLLLNRADTPGQFVVQPPIALFDDTVTTGAGNAPNGAAMALDDSLGGPALVTGRGGTVTTGLTAGFGGSGVGGANYTMAVSDFNADGSPDLVVSGTFRTLQSISGNLVNGVLTGTPVPTNYRASIYLAGNESAGTMRVSRPMRLREFTGINIPGATVILGAGTGDPRMNAGDTFVGTATGNFAAFNNFVPDVFHISINGKIYIDGNITSVLNHAPIVRINRSDLNAPQGQGRKVILTSGEMRTVPVTGADVDIPGDRLGFTLVAPPTGEQPPSFVRIANNADNRSATITIDTRNNGQGVNNGPGVLRSRIAVQATETNINGPGGRLALIGRDYFTLIVNPRSAPTIAPIANVILEAGRTQNVNLQVAERDGGAVTVTSKCDKDSYVSVNGTTLSIAPTDADVGTNTCTLTATGPTGLFSTTSFVITVRARNIAPTIANIGDQTVRQGQAVTVNITANDTPGDALRLTTSSPLAFVTLSDNGNGTGVLRIAPSLTDAQGGRVTVSVTDQGGLTASTSFNVTVQRAVVITNAVPDTGGKQFFISGSGFGTSGARVTINGQDVSSRISGQSDSSITVKGGRKKLNLKPGPNQVVVTAGGVTSNTFVVNLLKGGDE